MTHAGAQVSALWRYPVKSLRGEPLRGTRLEIDGLVGDRLVHVRDPDGRVVTSRRHPRLLDLDAKLSRDGEPLIDGRPWDAPESLAAVRAATGSAVELVRFSEPDHGQRYDVLPLTILTDGMVDALGYDYRRFRPNVLLSGVDGLTERDWVRHALRIGSVLVGVLKARQRCVMTTFDPDTLKRDPSVLRRIVRDFDGCAALDCWVIQPGTIAVGDKVTVECLPRAIDLPAGNAAKGRSERGA